MLKCTEPSKYWKYFISVDKHFQLTQIHIKHVHTYIVLFFSSLPFESYIVDFNNCGNASQYSTKRKMFTDLVRAQILSDSEWISFNEFYNFYLAIRLYFLFLSLSFCLSICLSLFFVPLLLLVDFMHFCLCYCCYCCYCRCINLISIVLSKFVSFLLHSIAFRLQFECYNTKYVRGKYSYRALHWCIRVWMIWMTDFFLPNANYKFCCLCIHQQLCI